MGVYKKVRRLFQQTDIFYLIRPAAGGMRGHLGELIRHFGGHCRLALAAPDEGDWRGLAWELEGGFLPLPLGSGFNPLGDMLSFRRVLRMLLECRPRLLHVHGFKAAMVGAPAAFLAGTPLLITVHNFPAHAGRFLTPLWLKRTMRGDTRFIAVSRELFRQLRQWGLPEERIHVVYNGIDPRRFEAEAGRRRPGGVVSLPAQGVSGEAVRVVGTVARLAPQKGLPVFLKAAARLAPDRPDIRFVIVGDGPERAALERLVLKLNLAGKVVFTGFSEDLPTLLAAMEVFVLPSLTEGHAISLLEALAAGCAVVASRTGGIPEVIEDGVGGLLTAPGDEAALAAAVGALLDSPGEARRLAAAGARRVRQQFSRQAFLAGTAEVYHCMGVKLR